MSLITIFTDHVVNRRSLKHYVEIRKSLSERGEFNDSSLIRAEENLQRLKKENPEVYEAMYETLDQLFKQDTGHAVEYPIIFTREMLKMFRGGMTPRKVLKDFQSVADHHFHDA